MRGIGIVGLGLVTALALAGAVDAQVGRQLLITMNLAAPVKPSGGSYYIAFTADETILTGPQSDSSNWTHYILLRQGRFFFGRVPKGAFRPFGFEAVRPPEPYAFGELMPDGRTVRVRVAITSLQAAFMPPAQIKLNLVTVDDLLRPLDALGPGASDRFAFVTLDLRKETYRVLADPTGDASDPSFDITGGEVQIVTP